MSGSSFRIELLLFVFWGCFLSLPSYSQEQKLIEQADSLFQHGIELYNAGQYQNAVILFEGVAETRKVLLGKSHPDYGICLNKAGNCYAELGDYEKAMEFYYQALAIIENEYGKTHRDYAGILNNIGMCLSDLGNYEKALECYHQALTIRAMLLGKNHPDYATSLSNIANCYSIIGDDEEALDYYFLALDIYKNTLGRMSSDYASCLDNIGICYAYLGDFSKGLEYCRQALTIQQTIFSGEHPDLAWSLSYMGVCYYELGDYSQALDCYEQALSIRERTLGSEHPVYAETLNYIGLCHYCLTDYAKALDYYQQALSIQEKTIGENHIDYATSLNNIGLCYSDLGDYLNALEYHCHSLRIYEDLFGYDYSDNAQTLDFIGFCYSNLGDFEKALENHQRALNIKEKTLGKEHTGYAATLLYIGGCLHDQEKTQDALVYYQQALRIHEASVGKEHPAYAVNLNNLGACYQTLGDYHRSLDLHQQALEVYKNALGAEHPEYGRGLYNVGVCYYELDDFSKATECFTSYAKASSSFITNTFSFLTESQRELFWNQYSGFFTDDLFLYSSVMASPEMCRTAYDGALLGKGLLLNAETEIRKLILESGDSKSLNLFYHVIECRSRLDDIYQDPIGGKGQIDSLRNEIEESQKALLKRSKAFGDYTRNLALKWTDVQKTLGKKDIAIEFETYTYQDTTFYLALTLRKGYTEPHLIELFNSKELAAIKPSRYYTSTALTDLIFGKLQDEIKGVQNVYFSPAGELNNIGIEYLVEKDGVRLINEKRNFYRLTSTRELVKKNRAISITNAVVYGGIRYDVTPTTRLTGEESYSERLAMYATRIGMLADSLYSKRGRNWDYLPGTKAEADAISSKMTEMKVNNVLLEGEYGTEESFKALNGLNLDVIHIATHGFYWAYREAIQHHDNRLSFMIGTDSDMPYEDKALTRSGLLFAGAQNTFSGKDIPKDIEDGILTAKEIARLDLRGADLVVISACQSGLGEIKGDGVFGLQRGFKKAGVQSIVMSLWEVNDEATKILMTRFYENLSKGQGKYSAFRRAQDSLRKYKGGIYDRPDYYASFVLLDAIN